MTATRIHYALHPVKGGARTACGRYSVPMSEHLADVTCVLCQRMAADDWQPNKPRL